MKNVINSTISMKKLCLFLLCGLLFVVGCNKPERTEPEETVPEKTEPEKTEPEKTLTSGTTGDLTWLLENGTLTISGTGAMPDYQILSLSYLSGGTTAPWYKYRDNITSVIIGDEISAIGTLAFNDCAKIVSVIIGKSVTSIATSAFQYCRSLMSIDVDNSNTVYCSEDGVLFNKAKTTLIIYPAVKAGAYTIPNSVKSIGDGAFSICSGLTSVIIPNTVTSIGNGAFAGCRSLTSVTIPNMVTSIGNAAFSGCSSLTSVTIPNSITSIEDWSFRDCSRLTSVSIPNSVMSIGNGAFYSSGLMSVTIPNLVTSIGIEAFGNCSGLTFINVDNGNTAYSSEDGVLFNKTKTSLILYPGGKTGAYTIPNSVKSIENYAFAEHTKLTTVSFSISVTDIGIGAFAYCTGLTSVTIGNSVLNIGQGAFQYCDGLKSVIIGNSVESIGEYAFFRCSSLSSVTISNSVITIGNQAFYYCSGLTEIINQKEIPQTLPKTWLGDIIVFDGVNTSTCTLRVPAASVAAYRVAEGWKDFKNIVAI